MLRLANEGDVEVVAAYNKAMALETEGLDIPEETLRRGVLCVVSGQAAARYYVIEVEGRVVAQLMITYEWSDWRAGNIWWIQSVYVLPEHRNRGYFKQLYHHVKEEARAQGAVGIRLYTHEHNHKAHTVYEKLGMRSQCKVFEDLFTDY